MPEEPGPTVEKKAEYPRPQRWSAKRAISERAKELRKQAAKCGLMRAQEKK